MKDYFARRRTFTVAREIHENEIPQNIFVVVQGAPMTHLENLRSNIAAAKQAGQQYVTVALPIAEAEELCSLYEQKEGEDVSGTDDSAKTDD